MHILLEAISLLQTDSVLSSRYIDLFFKERKVESTSSAELFFYWTSFSPCPVTQAWMMNLFTTVFFPPFICENCREYSLKSVVKPLYIHSDSLEIIPLMLELHELPNCFCPQIIDANFHVYFIKKFETLVHHFF